MESPTATTRLPISIGLHRCTRPYSMTDLHLEVSCLCPDSQLPVTKFVDPVRGVGAMRPTLFLISKLTSQY